MSKFLLNFFKIFRLVILIGILFFPSPSFAPPTSGATPVIIPPVDFPSYHRWIDIPSGAADEDIQRLIKSEAEKMVDRSEVTDYKDAINIFQNWMEEKGSLNEKWKKKMLELGSELRDQVAEVSKLNQEKIILENEKNSQEARLNALLSTLKNDSLSLRRYDEEKNFLQKNLESQLEDISYMIVCLGRRRVGMDEDKRTVLDMIGDKMMIEAIKDVMGTKISAETIVQNNTLLRSIVQSTQAGSAQVLDSYTNDFAVLAGNEDIRYLAQVIEAAPFKEKDAKNKTAGSVSNEPKVYIINRLNLDSIWDMENLSYQPFSREVKDVVIRLLEQAEKQNSAVSGKIGDILRVYNTRLNEINSNYSAVSASLQNHIRDKEKFQIEFNSVKKKFSDYETITLKPALESLKKINDSYKKIYDTRIFLADKTEESWLQETKPKEVFSNSASITVKKMKEFKELEYKETVIAVDYKLVSSSENVLTYQNKLRAFTILFLTRKQLAQNISYVACVGYQVEQNPKYSSQNAISSNTSSTSSSFQSPSSPLPGASFVKIPPGSFQMGSNEYGDEKPIHTVNIKTFYMMTTEVTQAQWQAVMGNNPSYFKGDNLPVECVSWNDVQEFLRKLNQKDPGKNYRLPSEAEWEYACRAGTTTKFYSGNNDSDLDGIAWYSGNSHDKTHPAGQKCPNVWGLYDISGNVWEWCQDWYHDSYKGAPTDGSAWESPRGSYRVLRGGSWYNFPNFCRSASRSYNSPDRRSYGMGFRLVRSS